LIPVYEILPFDHTPDHPGLPDYDPVTYGIVCEHGQANFYTAPGNRILTVIEYEAPGYECVDTMTVTSTFSDDSKCIIVAEITVIFF